MLSFLHSTHRSAHRGLCDKVPGGPTVLHVLHSLRAAGAEVLVRDLIADMPDYRFVVVALDEGGPLRAQLRAMGVPVYVFKRKPGFDWRCGVRIARLARRHRIDITHAHQYTPLVYSAFARLIGAGSSQLIFTEHGRAYPDIARPKRVWANRLVINRMVTRFTAVGAFIKKALVNVEKMPQAQIQVIHNGIPVDRFRPVDPVAGKAMRAALGLSPKQFAVLQVGRFCPVKDHATAIAALGHLRQMGTDAVLLLAGDGPLIDALKAQVATAGLEPFVRFLGVRTDVPVLWQAADAGLMTSLSEGISVAILEAMASGKPMVATHVGGNSEIIEQGVSGLLAPRGDAVALAQALHKLAGNPALRRHIGQAARARVFSAFDQAAMHRSYQRIYDELTGQSTQPSPAPHLIPQDNEVPADRMSAAEVELVHG